MKLTTSHERILRMLQQRSRASRDFTHNTSASDLAHISSGVVLKYIGQLIAAGYASEERDTFYITDQGRDWVLANEPQPPPRRKDDFYRQPVWNVRENANQHLRYGSRGMAC